MAVNIGDRVLPCLFVSDMRRSLEFYVEKLGFTQTGYYPIESEPIRTEIRRDDVALVLYTDARRRDDHTPAFTGAFYIFPESIERLAAELRERVPFAWGPEDTELGLREFAIRDPDGYTLIFAVRN
jgi:catechol 2,3-dioxygenase-like lactoylglutathione lyase family enzyme